MRNYCTLFDSAYLSRGLAMYESLVKHSSEPFRMFVLAMDNECELVLGELKLPGMLIDGIASLEEELVALKKVKVGRTHQEYCWTMASVYTWFNKTASHLDEVTYCDADLYFFSNPEQIFDEIGSRSIGIIPHRFESPKIATNGRFNVSWVTFKCEVGRECLNRWAKQCREWCFYRVELDRFADQKYLDEWPELYGDEVCEIQNPGAGLAPWNLQRYRLTDGPKVDGNPVVFYHFHEFAEKPNGRYRLTNYRLRPEDETLIYYPYINAYDQAKAKIESARLPA